jgi:hypothetical protein
MSTSLRIDTVEPIAGALVVGDTGLGILGSEIPSSGTHGPGFAYDSVLLQPSYAGKEYRATISSMPANLSLLATETTAFTATGPDGTHVVSWSLYEDGALVGSTSFSVTFGATSSTAQARAVR